MATGGLDERPGNNSILTTGSEAVFDHTCQPCGEEASKEAIGFCVDCDEWLCDECYRFHTRPKPTRNHVLKNIEEMGDFSPPLKTVAKCTEKCDQHNDKKLKYFCPVHNSLGCSMCIFHGHRLCQVQHIPGISKDTATKDELNNMSARLEAVATESQDVVANIGSNMEQVKMNKTETVNAFRNYRHELVKSLDEIEGSLSIKCENNESREIAKLQHSTEDCKAIGQESSAIKKNLDDLKNKGQYCDAFVIMKRSENRVKTLEDKLNGVKVSSSISLYKFQPNRDISKLLHGSRGIGTLVKRRLNPNKDYSTLNAHHFTDISVGADGEKVCAVKGSVLLPGNKLVITDESNAQVKVIDTISNKVVSKYKVDGKPISICEMNGHSVVVADCSQNKLLFLDMDSTGKLSLQSCIDVKGTCAGVANTEDRLIVTYIRPFKVEIMDFNGTVLHTFQTDAQGKLMFNYPQYAALSPDKTSVYVSNLSSNTVTCMGLDGSVTAVYKDKDLRGPEQIAVDDNGMVYVGGYYSNNVHLIAPDCKKTKVILSETDGIKKVFSISYCGEEDKLYIGMDECNAIKVFQLS